MNAALKNHYITEWSWCLKAKVNEDEEDYVTFKTEKRNGVWYADTMEVEAVLSLSLSGSFCEKEGSDMWNSLIQISPSKHSILSDLRTFGDFESTEVYQIQRRAKNLSNEFFLGEGHIGLLRREFLGDVSWEGKIKLFATAAQLLTEHAIGETSYLAIIVSVRPEKLHAQHMLCGFVWELARELTEVGGPKISMDMVSHLAKQWEAPGIGSVGFALIALVSPLSWHNMF